jgi:endonuclease YncB( thermonuclease family)
LTHIRSQTAGLLVVLLVAALPAQAQTRTATVLSIGDGDTLRVQEGSRTLNVRLACIDAPETIQAPHGTRARAQLQALAPVGSSVELRVKATDRYGRSVAELSRGGRNLNQALVASGAAFVYWQYISGCDRQTYSRLENEARLKGLGVWGVSGGVQRPWDYRSGQRKPASSSSAPSGRRYTCKQIGSYAQAQVLLRQGHNYLDGDGDGEACESLQG